MLSRDEVDNGRIFILKLHDKAGAPFQWVQKLRGAQALRMYSIYRTSDWNALRNEAAGVFVSAAVSEHEAERVRNSRQRFTVTNSLRAAGDEAQTRNISRALRCQSLNQTQGASITVLLRLNQILRRLQIARQAP